MLLEDYVKKTLTSRVYDVAVETPLQRAPRLTERLGNQVLLKREDLQPVFSFKIRGAYNKLAQLSAEELARGVVTASAGNHAQGLALAARELGIEATIVMPRTTPELKVQGVRARGGKVVLHGDAFPEALAHAWARVQAEGLTFIPPYDDPEVIAGQGTVAMEILRQHPGRLDAIFVPVGGGGLACGVSTFAKLHNPHIKVIGVEPAGAPSLTRALEAGYPVRLDAANTIADGTAVLEVGDQVFPYLRENLDDVITVPDEELIVSFLDMVENHKMIVENSGLLTVAALKHLPADGRRVVSILSGGNMDVITMSSVVQHGLIQRGRIFTVGVLLPDRPGMLVKVASIIAEQNGNVIKLEHNQFVSTNRNAAVELKVTIEAFGEEHKAQIVEALAQSGLDPRVVQTSL